MFDDCDNDDDGYDEYEDDEYNNNDGGDDEYGEDGYDEYDDVYILLERFCI